MIVQEFYDSIGGDYNDVKGRMLKDERILKYLRRFPEDKNYEELFVNLAEKNYEEAFRNVHTLKGLALNLGLAKLGAASSALCEELRQGPPAIDITDMAEAVKTEYGNVMNCIGAIEG